MPERMRAAVEAWRAANEDASAAEHALADAFDKFFKGIGPEPGPAEQSLARSLRARANELLNVALLAGTRRY